MAELKDLLSQEIECHLNDLGGLEPGSEERSRAVDDFSDLYKLHIEEVKIDLAHQEEIHKMAEDNKRWKIGTAILIGGGIAKYGWKHFWMRKGFEFEKTGTFCYGIVKQYILPWIKLK